jgi:hypothetical protein
MLGETARARPVLRCSPLLSRQNKSTDYRYKYAREHACNEQQIPAIHVQPPTSSLHLPKAITARGAKDQFWDTGSFRGSCYVRSLSEAARRKSSRECALVVAGMLRTEI